MPDDLIARIRHRASNPTTRHDYAKQMPGIGKIHPPATAEQITATETDLGFPLPDLLKQIFTQIGNGGFGPGYSLIGAQGGYADFKGGDLPDLARQLGALDRQIVPLCNWGCGIYSCLECSKPDAPVSIFNPRINFFSTENITNISITSASGKTAPVYEGAPKPKRPAIQTPETLTLIPHKSSFCDFMSDWASGLSLWDQFEPSLK